MNGEPGSNPYGRTCQRYNKPMVIVVLFAIAASVGVWIYYGNKTELLDVKLIELNKKQN